MSSSPPKYELWADRTDAVEGPGLHALIIGVSDYTYLPAEGQFPVKGRFTLGLNKVNIPCTSVFRVAKWLRDDYWHPSVKLKSIDLMMSPSAIEITPEKNPPDNDDDRMRSEVAAAAADPRVRRANTANVDAALKAWRARCVDRPQDIALLYVCGHGIQQGHQDGIVLLEDFGEDDDRFLKETIDIGKTFRGMRADNLPQTQLYFVDACRMNASQLNDYLDQGEGVHVSGKIGPEHRSAPIYFSAVSQTKANGEVGPGTYFSQALVRCFKRDALKAPDTQSDEEIERYWHITVLGLQDKLQKAVDAVAGKGVQTVVLGGATRAAFFSASKSVPTVTVELDVEPDKAARASEAELRTVGSNLNVRGGPHPCWERPLVIEDVPAGIYLLHVSAPDGFKPTSEVPIVVDAVNQFSVRKKLSMTP